MAIKLEINMTNKWLYSLIAVGVLLALGVGVYAYNSGGSPSVFGHSADEISGLPNFTSMDYVIENWNSPDGTSWYRKYKSGWIEQGGISSPLVDGYIVVNLPHELISTNYSVTATLDYGSISALSYKSADIVAVDNKTENSFRILGSTNADTAIGSISVSWHLFGN